MERAPVSAKNRPLTEIKLTHVRFHSPLASLCYQMNTHTYLTLWAIIAIGYGSYWMARCGGGLRLFFVPTLIVFQSR